MGIAVGRIGDVQSYVLVLISRGVKSFREVVDTLHRFSIPKSSVYTAIEELSRRGLVIRNGDRVELSEAGKLAVSQAVRYIAKRVSELTLALRLIGGGEAIDKEALSSLDPDSLRELKARLEELLKVVEEALRSWRIVKVEAD